MTGTLNREKATCRWLSGLSGDGPDQGAWLAGQGAAELSPAQPSSAFCHPDFDKSLCWFNVSLGQLGHRSCPFRFCSSLPGCQLVQQTYRANRLCHDNGTWGDSDYAECIQLLKQHQMCVVGYCRTCPDPLRETVISVSLALSVLSVCVLLAALVLFSAFDSVQCRRLSIHKNLAAAFVLRFAILAVWTLVNSQNMFRDCRLFVPQPLAEWEWFCKLLLFGVIYFQVSSVIWMLIEGIYLYSRFTVLAMRRSEVPYLLYLLTGWGFPFAVVLTWALVHERRSSESPGSYCWLPYAQGAHLWILAGTMGLALILNVLLLLAIVLILVQKLRNESTAESKKIWRTVKSTMLLVPLLGVSNVPLFYEPSKPGAFYMLGSAILQHSQGIFIAVLYCFLNAEIQNALRRQLGKVSLLRSLGFPSRSRHFETERTYLPAHEESRGQMPMQDLPAGGGRRPKNGSRRVHRGRPPPVQSSSLNAGLSGHAQPRTAENCPGAMAGNGTTSVMSTSCGPLEFQGQGDGAEGIGPPSTLGEAESEQRLIAS